MLEYRVEEMRLLDVGFPVLGSLDGKSDDGANAMALGSRVRTPRRCIFTSTGENPYTKLSRRVNFD